MTEAIRQGIDAFEPARPMCLRPDWSVHGIGYFLLQKKCDCPGELPGCCSGGWDAVLAGSRSLNTAESKFAPTEGEALAVLWGLEQTKYFTRSCSSLTVAVDHLPLAKLLGSRTLQEEGAKVAIQSSAYTERDKMRGRPSTRAATRSRSAPSIDAG